MTQLLQLLAVHALCDYPLQGDFLARGKNHLNPIIGVPWYTCLLSHAAIHAGGVLLVTGNPVFAVAEFLAHAVIDYLKCSALLTFNEDQALHIACKVVYFIVGAGK